MTQQSNEESEELHKAHLIQTLQGIQYINGVVAPDDSYFFDKQVVLPPSQHPHEKVIIFDLDETLVHCVDDPDTDNPDVVLPIHFPNGEVVDAGINVRPYAIECLQAANEFFQVVVFTASHQSYADVVLDYLDPGRELIQARLYREHCIQPEPHWFLDQSEGAQNLALYIKDLRIIANRDLEDMVIVDNAVYSFGFQLDNGVPIIPFYDSP